MEAAGEPSITQNGDGSYTASWDFDEPANYTAGNATINGGEVSLASSGTSYWLQDDDKDFQKGKCQGAAEVVNGNLSLTPQSRINLIENSHFNSSNNWDFQSATKGFIVADWDGDKSNARLWHNMTYSGASPFDSMDDIIATNWSEDMDVQFDDGDFKQNLALPLVEGIGNLNATITSSGPASQYGVQRDDPGKWNMSGVGSIVIQIYIESSSGEMVHIQLAGDAMIQLTNWESPDQVLQSGWNIYEFDITPFDGSGGGNMRDAVDVLRIHITNIPNFLPRNVYVDDIRLVPVLVSIKPVILTGYVNQTFSKDWLTEDQPGIVELTFDYTIEEVKDVNVAMMFVFIDDMLVWPYPVAGPEPWTTFSLDTSSLMTEKRDYNISLQLQVDAVTGSNAYCSVRYDNVLIKALSPENGTFDSQVFNAGDIADWKYIEWGGLEPVDSTISLYLRMGDSYFDTKTEIKDGTWDEWIEQSNQSEIIGGHSRFLQFRAVLNVTNTSSIPVLDWVNITYSIYEFESIQTRYEEFIDGKGENYTVLRKGTVQMANAPKGTGILSGRTGAGGRVYSISNTGVQLWENGTGSITSVTNADFDQDGVLDDAIVGSNDTNVYMFDENGIEVGLFTDPTDIINNVSKIDIDCDGSYDEGIAGSDDDYVYVFDFSGFLIWSNITDGDVRDVSMADFDGDGYFDDVIACASQYVYAFNETGGLLSKFDAKKTVTAVDYIDIDSDGKYDEVIAGTMDGMVFGISEGGTKIWDTETKFSDPVTVISNFDIESDGILNDAVFGDEDGWIYVYSSQDKDVYGKNKLAVNPISSISKVDLNSDGAFNEIIVGVASNTVHALDRRGGHLWQNKTGGNINSVSMADFDGDGFFDDTIAGCDDGSVYTFNETGSGIWGFDNGGPVGPVTYLEKGSYTYKGNYSHIFNACCKVQWETLNWVENIVPGLSDVTFRIRTGNTSTPDETWSLWSSEFTNPPGEDISQWRSRFLQYEINFTRTGGPTLPGVDEIRIRYHKYARNGTIETEDIIQDKVVGWGVFDATTHVPWNTSLSFWFSTDSGSSWNKVKPGDDLSAAPIPKIRFRINLSTRDTSITPIVYAINLTYEIDDMVPLVKVNIPTYGPFNSDPGNIIDVDFDYGGNGNITLDLAQYKVGLLGPWSTIFSMDTDVYTAEWGVDWTDLTEGWNAIYIRCYDLAGNVNDTETVSIFRDTIIPDIVSGFNSQDNTGSTILLNWNAVSEGGSGFMNYTIYYDTTPNVDENDATWSYVQQANLTQNSTCCALITGLAENTTYYFKIIVHDIAGNNGSFTDAAEISVKTNGPPNIVGLDILGHADGEPIYAGLTYIWQVVIHDPDDIADLDFVTLILDPSGIGMEFIWTEDNDTVWETWDPNSDISLESYSSTRSFNTVFLNLILRFGWTYEYETLYEPYVEVYDGDGAMDVNTFSSETWRGENDLEFSGVLSVTSEFQGSLASGDWVRAGETISWQGLNVVFEGSVISPLDSDFDIAIADDGGNLWRDLSGPLDLDTVSDFMHDDEDIHNIIVINVPGSSTVPSSVFSIKVDNYDPLVAVNLPSYGPYKTDPGSIIDVDFEMGEGMNSSLARAQYNIGMNNGWVDIFTSVMDNYTVLWHLDWDALSTGWNDVYIRCYDAVGNMNDAWQISFYKGNVPPEAPVLLSPTNNSIEISTYPKLSWTEPADLNGDGIQFYMLEWSSREDFSMDMASRLVTENYHDIASPLNDSTRYYWRVRAFDGENWGDYSGVFSFFLDTLFYNPRITEKVPDQIKPEDFGFWTLNLQDYAEDMDAPQSQLRWYITGWNASLFKIYDENTTNLTFSTIDDVHGSSNVILWVTDPDGNADFQSLWINITPVNDPPRIESIDPLIIHYDSPYTYRFFNYVSDFETPREELTLTTDESDYTSIDGLNVTFNYPKNMLGQSGTVIVTVWDGDGASSATVVLVKITSDWVPELVSELPDIILYEGELKNDVFDLDDYFIDPDEDSLYYVTGNSNVNIIIKDNHGVDVSAPSNWYGTEYVSFIALDPLKARVEDIVQITVLPVNDPPVIAGVPDLVVHYNELYIFDLTPYISDPDTDWHDLILSTQTDNISFSGFKMMVNLPESYYGSVIAVSIDVSDGMETASDTIVITVSDDHPPIALVENLPHVWFYEDTSYTTIWSLHGYFLDADPEDTLFYFNTTGGLDIAIDQALGTIQFSAPENWSGIVSINIRAMDPHGAIAEAPMLVTVIPVNDPPVIDHIPDQEYKKGQSWIVDLRDYVIDIDNDAYNFTDLTIGVRSQYPESVTVAGHFILFDYPSNVRYDEVTVTISDGINETSRTFSVVITSKPEKSLWSQISDLWWIILPLLSAIIVAILMIRRVLIKDKEVTIEDIFLIDSNGILINHATRRARPNIDNDMLAGMLTAVQTFITDSFKYSDDTTALKSLEFGNKELMIERGKYSYLAIIHAGEFSEAAEENIKEWLDGFEKRYAYVLKDWLGDTNALDGLDEEFAVLFRTKLNRPGVGKLGLHRLSRRLSGLRFHGTAGAPDKEDTSHFVPEDNTMQEPFVGAYEEFDETGKAGTTPSHALSRLSLEDDDD
jgi:hypothetical protein